MRVSMLLTVCVLATATGALQADDDLFVARTGKRLINPENTAERAGTAKGIRSFGEPSVGYHSAAGMVGGGRNFLRLFRTSAESTRRPGEGTFGWDYVGFGYRPGRVFMGWFNGNNSHQSPILPRYNTDGPRVKDYVAVMPIKRAIKEAKEEKREEKEGGEGHGAAKPGEGGGGH